jgi:hypothetical protein
MGAKWTIPPPYRQELPLALMTARNVERNGGGPFHLRAGETKKIPVCWYQVSQRSLQMNFEAGVPDHMLDITFISEADLVIEFLVGKVRPKSVCILL